MGLASYHNHTRWSDGKDTTVEMIAAAERLGLAEVGISDHLALHPGGGSAAWEMDPSALRDYVRELLDARDRTKGVTVRLGVEVDWFPSEAARIRDTLADLPFDHVIGSVHYLGGFLVDAHAEHWRKLTPDQRDDKHQAYWEQIGLMAQSRLFDVVGHIDLSKKFGFLPRRDLSGVVADALDAVKEAGLIVELNTAGWFKACKDGYPSPAILRECRRREIPVTLSSDAHQADHLLRGFKEGAERLIEAGYDSVARFANRTARFEPITSAVPQPV